MPKPDRRTHIEENDAKAGSNEGVVRWVLLISLGLAIVALTIIWVTGALNEGPVESEGTATGRIEQQIEQEGTGEGSSIDGINPEVGDDLSEQGEAAP